MAAEVTVDWRVYSAQPGWRVTRDSREPGDHSGPFPGWRADASATEQRLSTRVLLEEKTSVLTLKRGQFLDSGGGRIAYVLADDGKLAERRSSRLGHDRLPPSKSYPDSTPGTVW